MAWRGKDRQLTAEEARLVLTTALGIVPTRQDAEDVLQEVQLKLQSGKAPRILLLTAEQRSGYLVTMTRNTCIDLMRKTRRELPLDEETDIDDRAMDGSIEPGFDSTSAHALANLAQERVNLALDRLPERNRLLLEWKYYQLLPYTEIAQRLNTSTNAAHVMVSRAKNKLRSELKGDGFFDDYWKK